MSNLELGQNLVLALLVTTIGFFGAGCGLLMTHRQPGPDPSSRMLVLQSEAHDIDAWSAVSTSYSSEHGCEYWKAIQAEGGKSKRVDEYITVRVERACIARQRWAVAQREARRREEEHRAYIRELADQELETGSCTPDNAAMFEAWALFIKDAMKLRFDGGGQPKLFTFVGHEVVVAGDGGARLQLDSWMTRELHLFAFSRLPVELDVRAGSSAPATLPSPFENQVAYRCSYSGRCVMSKVGDPPAPEERTSRVVLAQDSAGFTIDVRGEGCVLVMGFAGS